MTRGYLGAKRIIKEKSEKGSFASLFTLLRATLFIFGGDNLRYSKQRFTHTISALIGYLAQYGAKKIIEWPLLAMPPICPVIANLLPNAKKLLKISQISRKSKVFTFCVLI